MDPHKQGQSSWVLRDIFTKATKPTTEFEAIFKAAENKSEMTQLKIEKISATDYQSRSSLSRKNYPLEAVALIGHVGTVQLFLKQRDVLRNPHNEISDAIKVAASNFH